MPGYVSPLNSMMISIFFGINYCSTYKKVSKDPHFISIYFREYEIHYYQAVVETTLILTA